MTYIIPDVHQNIEVVEKFLSERDKPGARFVFLGDWFDKFDSQPGRGVEATAEFLKSILHDENKVFLYGNHDIQYRWAKYGLMCSGWTKSKFDKIWRVFNFLDWEKFKLHHWEHGTLLTHAGLNGNLVSWATEPVQVRYWLESETKGALDLIGSFDSVVFVRNIIRPVLGVGESRGGWQAEGGLTWNDWRDHKPIKNISQIFGHTVGKEVRQLSHGMNLDFCIDTQLKHYIELTEEKIEVKEF